LAVRYLWSSTTTLFYVDLLSSHIRLHSYFVIELKTGEFQPEYAGKLDFYLWAIDGTMRTPIDGPTIGLLLCESRSGPIEEYALQNLIQPIGASTYRVTHELPEPGREELPSVEDLQEVFVRRWRRCGKSWLMRNRALRTAGRHGFIPSVNCAISYCTIGF
jgi:YhcG PDDEXK nuclease domain